MNINVINNYLTIQENINKNKLKRKPEVIAVSKTFSLDHIMPLIKSGHRHFGENKVQEAQSKWHIEENLRNNINLHMIGKLQSNKAKTALKVFDYIHSLDNQKLADTLSKGEKDLDKKIKYFIQVNVGEEDQKSGISLNYLDQFYNYCSKELNLNIIGLMGIPPADKNPTKYFELLNQNNTLLNLPHLSMGMSNDYITALKHGSSFLRIGSLIFGKRS